MSGCATCGNPWCSSCAEPLEEGYYTHICWYECICCKCSGPPLTDEELEEIFAAPATEKEGESDLKTCPCCGDVAIRVVMMTDAEQAVIDAAQKALPDLRGFMHRHYEIFGHQSVHRFETLIAAIEALQKARQG